MNQFFFSVILISVVIAVSLLVAMYSTYFERRLAAFLQDRRGPNRAGPFGLLQPLMDGVKLFFKEEIIPANAEKILFMVGPGLAMMTAMLGSAVIPWGHEIELFGEAYALQVTDINVALLYVLGVLSVGVYGILVGAWASNNKYSLLGGLRAASQIISYELALGMSLIPIVMITGSLSLKEIVLYQQQNMWNVVYQPLGFLIFLICAFAECNRAPFDLPESENELVGGYHAEYSSMKLGFYLFAEYINMFISGVMISTLFFGGYDMPFVDESLLSTNVAALVGVVALLGKSFLFIFLCIWVRWTLPRFRFDQLMNLGWRKLIPLALINLLITAYILITHHS